LKLPDTPNPPAIAADELTVRVLLSVVGPVAMKAAYALKVPDVLNPPATVKVLLNVDAPVTMRGP
jgi:hypothetical protein